MRSRNHTLSGSRAREQRRADAEVRAQSRALSTAKQQIVVLATRPGASAREISRLTGEPSNKKSGKTKKQRAAS